jgi:hypothetical protein
MTALSAAEAETILTGLAAVLPREAPAQPVPGIESPNVGDIPCRFECDQPVLVTDVNVATHLYHIARKPSTTR